jgi:hypothetical protein
MREGGQAMTSIQPVTWYDSPYPANRVASVQWWPNDDDEDAISGRLYFCERKSPGAVWPVPILLREAASFVTARQIAVAHGCPYDAARCES